MTAMTDVPTITTAAIIPPTSLLVNPSFPTQKAEIALLVRLLLVTVLHVTKMSRTDYSCTAAAAFLTSMIANPSTRTEIKSSL